MVYIEVGTISINNLAKLANPLEILLNINLFCKENYISICVTTNSLYYVK